MFYGFDGQTFAQNRNDWNSQTKNAENENESTTKKNEDSSVANL
jgi:hypothetical protein